MSNFSKYHLRDNPFPNNPEINLLSKDPRLNGDIFNEEIFCGELSELKKRTEQGVNVIYISGHLSDRGLGKSALMIHHMRSLKNRPHSTSVYIRCLNNDKPKDLAYKIIAEWHNSVYLWEAFKIAFIEFSRYKGDSLLSPDSVAELVKIYSTLPEKLPLSIYTHQRNSDKLANEFGNWAASNLSVDKNCLITLFRSYLSYPMSFSDSGQIKKVDSFFLFEACIKFLVTYGFKRHFLFIDQFEDMVLGTQKSKIDALSLGMKNFIRASSDSAIFFLTLHQVSEMSLKSSNAKDMTSVAPLDAIHRVDLMTSETEPEKTISLAGEYFNFFREGEAPYLTYPVRPELLELMWFMNQGIIRNFLQQLHTTLNHGRENGYPELTFEYALEHQGDVLGKEVTQKNLEDLNEWKRKTPK